MPSPVEFFDILTPTFFVFGELGFLFLFFKEFGIIVPGPWRLFAFFEAYIRRLYFPEDKVVPDLPLPSFFLCPGVAVHLVDDLHWGQFPEFRRFDPAVQCGFIQCLEVFCYGGILWPAYSSATSSIASRTSFPCFAVKKPDTTRVGMKT